MKRTRKGFTLVELLIVVAILGVLSASMMITIPGTTARAKANAIKANLETCRTAAVIYYANHLEDSTKPLSSTKGQEALKDVMGEWTDATDSATMTKGGVLYTVSGATPDKWQVTASFADDNDAGEITTLLTGVNGITVASNVATLILIPGLE